MNDMAIRPKNLTEMVELSKLLADSDFVPKDCKGKPGNIIVAIQMGAEVGLAPMQALQNIAVINGRPSIWGDALLAIVQSSQAYEWHKERIEGEGKTLRAVCEIKRRGNDAPHVGTFSVADAEKACLWSKPGPWAQYPARMLQMRARAFAARDGFADALRGLQVAEEVQDIPSIDVELAVPKRLSEKPNGAAEVPALPVPIDPVANAEPSAAPEFINEKQINRLRAVIRGAGRKEEELIDFLGREGIRDITEIPRAKFEAVIQWATRL